MATTIYTRGRDELRDFGSDTFRALLVTASYTPNVDHDFVADVSANELAGSGYSRPTLASKSRTIDDTNNRIVYDAADPSFGTIVAGETARYMIVYRFVTDDSDSILVACYDIGSQATNGAPFVVTLSSDGLLYAG